MENNIENNIETPIISKNSFKGLTFKLASINKLMNKPQTEIWLEFANFFITTIILMFCFPYIWQQIIYGTLSILFVGYTAYNSYRKACNKDVLCYDKILWKYPRALTFILFVTGILPTIIGYYVDGYSKDIIEFQNLIFENLLPNICVTLISSSLLFHLRGLNNKNNIDNRINLNNIAKENHLLMSKIVAPIILNFTFITTLKYYEIRPSHAYLFNTLFLFIVVYIGTLSSFYMFLAYIHTNKPLNKIELIYPFRTLLFCNFYLASYGLPTLLREQAKFEFTIFISLAIAFLVVAIILYYYAIRTTKEKTKPIVQMLLIMIMFFIIVILTALGVEEKNVSSSINEILISTVTGIFVAILLVLLGLQQSTSAIDNKNNS